MIGSCSYSDPRVENATLLLSKLPEHTWGLNGVFDNVNWTNEAFSNARTGMVMMMMIVILCSYIAHIRSQYMYFTNQELYINS